MHNRSIPDSAIIPVLQYADVHEAAQWLCAALGFHERLRIGDHRIQLQWGDSALVVAAGRADAVATGGSIMLRVADVDRVCAEAVRLGATVLSPATNHVYGERQCTLRDPGGHLWTLTQTIADVDPATWGGELLAR
jgi:uncharacterized glyoxalase superfamily protein PhnB